jgi:thiaminase (transcriptional activator TenA)
MISDVLHIMFDQRGRGISAVLRERGGPAWAAATSHPMVARIGTGSLPHETFRRYFEQNILYLQDYARAIALIAGKAPDLPALDVLTRFLTQIVGAEIPENAAFLRRLGGCPEAACTASMLPTTHAYTRHLLAVAAQGTCAEGLTAVLPCQWSYGELARELMGALPADPVYANWIAMFGNDEYGALVDETTALLDRLAGSRDEAGVQALATIFDTSTRYEVQFWDMAYGEPARPGGTPDKEPAPSCVLPESSRT